ncbi:hypothetical protein RKE29_05010 [Streptomyces sp. B1866]|uniref:hypothetical protein n=1 Tax=Streptomyces sp. B1866 TaxID=3075431 RepID=UPI00289016D9|nr:hypothetical protein [Streptomyces sp. B1866]MDT3396008.1 hypothetical protein [Streptomyces sp. B1866]
MPNRRQPNASLRAALAEADWSHAQLLRCVAQIAAENGWDVSHDRSVVSHWLCGVQPRPHTARLVAEALTRRLNRAITPPDLGWSDGPHASGAAADGCQGAAAVSELCAAEADPRRAADLRATPYQAALARPTPWTAPHPARPRSPREAADRVGTAEAEEVERMARAFHQALTSFGGAHARRSLSCYLREEVTGWLRADSGEEAHRRLLRGAAQLAFLLAQSCVDDLAHHLAQRYHRLALRLAREADAPDLYAVTVRAMSAHAQSLGHHRAALRLAAAACEVPVPRGQTGIRSFLLAQRAVTRARAGERRAALADLDAALEAHQAQQAGSAGPFVRYPFAALAFQQARTWRALGDTDGAVAAFQTSLEHRDGGQYRPRVLAGAALAELHLLRGDVPEACQAADSAFAEGLRLQSARTARDLALLRRRLSGYRGSEPVRDLLRRHPLPRRAAPRRLV